MIAIGGTADNVGFAASLLPPDARLTQIQMTAAGLEVSTFSDMTTGIPDPTAAH